MDRCNIADGTWFDRAKAALVSEEGTRWNGNNHISRATGSQWSHEELLRTARGAYVLHSWSQWQGSHETFEILSREDASRWILRCAAEDAGLPDELVEFAELGEI